MSERAWLSLATIGLMVIAVILMIASTGGGVPSWILILCGVACMFMGGLLSRFERFLPRTLSMTDLGMFYVERLGVSATGEQEFIAWTPDGAFARTVTMPADYDAMADGATDVIRKAAAILYTERGRRG